MPGVPTEGGPPGPRLSVAGRCGSVRQSPLGGSMGGERDGRDKGRWKRRGRLRKGTCSGRWRPAILASPTQAGLHLGWVLSRWVPYPRPPDEVLPDSSLLSAPHPTASRRYYQPITSDATPYPATQTPGVGKWEHFGTSLIPFPPPSLMHGLPLCFDTGSQTHNYSSPMGGWA